MAAFEGGLLAALAGVVLGIAPGRRVMPQAVMARPVSFARIEPALEMSGAMSKQNDVSDACPDVSPGPVGPSVLSDDVSDDDRDEAAYERQRIAGLCAKTGRDLYAWMAVIDASGHTKLGDVMEHLRTIGLSTADASWLFWVHKNGKRPVYDERKTIDDAKPASTRAFVGWWRANTAAPREVSQPDLLALYADYCAHEGRAPLSDRQLLNKLKTNGVESFRAPTKIVNGKMHRPTVYRIRAKRAAR